MKLINIASALEEVAPPTLQGEYDNSGLIVGSFEQDVRKALFCLDSTEEVINEAIAKGCDLVIAHHPIVFKGLKRFNGTDYVQRAVIKAIQNNIAIYACHTNLDNVLQNGVNEKIANKLGLKNHRILKPMQNNLLKISVFVPSESKEKVTEAMFAAGAGHVGEYSECSFEIQGTGTFKPGENTSPFIGQKLNRNEVTECRIEMLTQRHRVAAIVKAMKLAHPYEEVAFDVVALDNTDYTTGSGLIGELPKSISQIEFLELLKNSMDVEVVKYTSGNAEIRKVAVCGGAGSFLIHEAKRAGMDAFVTSDVKYHEFFDAENRLMICDIGHYESEKYTIEIFAEIISGKFPNFATIFSDTYTNPVKYHY